MISSPSLLATLQSEKAPIMHGIQLLHFQDATVHLVFDLNHATPVIVLTQTQKGVHG